MRPPEGSDEVSCNEISTADDCPTSSQPVDLAETADLGDNDMFAEEETNLANLPTEMLHTIFNYLTAKELCGSVQRVCCRMDDIVGDRRYWLGRIRNELAVELDERQKNAPTFSAARAHHAIQHETRRWTGANAQAAKVVETGFSEYALRLFATSDGSTLCASGSQDGSLCVRSLPSTSGLNADPVEVARKGGAHTGWVWNIDGFDSVENTLVSGAFDGFVKLWSLGDGRLTEVRATKRLHPSRTIPAVFSVSKFTAGARLIACGSVGNVSLLDRRQLELVQAFQPQRTEITSVSLNGNRVFSASVDRRLVVTDIRRAERPLQVIRYPPGSTPTRMTLANGLLYVPFENGGLHVLDEKTLLVIGSLEPNPDAGKMWDVCPTPGALYLSHNNRQLRVSSPQVSERPNRIYATVQLPHQPLKMDALDGHVVISTDDGLLVYSPSCHY